MANNNSDFLQEYEELISENPEISLDEIFDKLAITGEEQELIRIAHSLRVMGKTEMEPVSLDPEQLLSITPSLKYEPPRRFSILRNLSFAAAAVVVIISLVISPAIVTARQTREISGIVQGVQTQGDLSGYTIKITSLDTRQIYEAVTTAGGYFRTLDNLESGRYTVSVESNDLIEASVGSVVRLHSDGTMEVISGPDYKWQGADVDYPNDNLVLMVTSKESGVYSDAAGGITGTITVGDSEKTANLFFAGLIPLDSDSTSNSIFNSVDNDGFYILHDISPGNYEFTIYTQEFYQSGASTYLADILHSSDVVIEPNKITIKDVLVSSIKHEDAESYDRIDDYAVAGTTDFDFGTPEFKVLWYFNTDHVISDSKLYNSEGEWEGILPADIDSDGVKEILIGEGKDEFYLKPPRDKDPNNYGNVYLVDQDGTELWKFSTGTRSDYRVARNLTSDDGLAWTTEIPVDQRYSVVYMQPVEADGTAGLEVFTASNHSYSASRLVLLDSDGSYLNDFFNWGHLPDFAVLDEQASILTISHDLNYVPDEGANTGWMISDFDADGKDELVTSSVWKTGEEEYKRVIFCLDLDEMGGYAPTYGEDLPEASGIKWIKVVPEIEGEIVASPNEGWIIERTDGGFDISMGNRTDGDGDWNVTFDSLTGESEDLLDL